MKSSDISIGLFGTCDNSKWRVPFMKTYDELEIKYFNPEYMMSKRFRYSVPEIGGNHFQWINRGQAVLHLIL